MKKLLFIVTVLTSSVVFGQSNILDARSFGVGQTVTVSGVVTNGSELGTIRYMQDGTAGIAAFGNSLSSVQRYDSITVTGQISDFSGLLEIAPITNVVNHGPAVVQPVPVQIPVTAANESLESQYALMNNLTFVQTGNFATGNSTVQVTDGANSFDVRINGSTNIDGTAIPTGTVSIYGLIGQFNTNYQIVPRALNDIVPYVAPDKEINITIGGSTILTGSNYFIGTTVTTPITVENLGVNNLTISGSSFTGVNSADFANNLATGPIAGGSSVTFNLTYTAGGNGSRFASISIGSDDPDENPYIINFEAVGTNGFATEPTSNPTSLTFPINESYKLGGQYSAGVGATKYLVLWKNGSSITGAPVDGNTYKRGDVVGDAKVAYVGSGVAFSPRGIIANQNYNFVVYAFNGQGGFENYLMTAPLVGSVTTPGKDYGTYYNGINTASATFLTSLSALVNPHNFISYFNYKQTMMSEFEVRDTTDGKSFVTCVYSGERKVFTDPFDWTATNFSREHVYAHSWMPSNPANSPEQPEYTDQHNLQPVNFSNVNAVRSNYPLGNVVTVQSTYLGAKYGLNANNKLVYEPRDEMKGNVARSMMYEAIAYNGDNGGQNWAFPSQISFSVPYGQDVEVIKAWHFQDLPDNYEIARNEYVYSLQNNRNPFIDSVEFACYVDFYDMSYESLGCASGVEELLIENLNVYPVPANNVVFVQVNGTDITEYQLLDLNGRIVAAEVNLQGGAVKIDVSQLSTGVFVLNVKTPYGNAHKQIVIE